MYTLRVSYVAQSGVVPCGHPIVEECWENEQRCVRVNVSYGGSMGPGPVCPTVVDSLGS